MDGRYPNYPPPPGGYPYPPSAPPGGYPYPYPPPPPGPEPFTPAAPIIPGTCEMPKPGYYWVTTTTHSGVPSTALVGGYDADGQQIYVGRAYFRGDWIPAKVIPGKHAAYVAYDGEEHVVDRFEVLCEQRFDWVPSHGGHIPPGAVEGGRTSDGEPLYIGRAHHHGSLTVGKVHPSHRTCYIPFGGEEHAHKNYEILVLRS